MEKVTPQKEYAELLRLIAKCIETLDELVKEYGEHVQAEHDRYKVLFNLVEDLEESTNNLRKLAELD